MFSQNEDPSIEELKKEFNFYLEFELENQGFYKTGEYLKKKYKGREACKKTMQTNFSTIDLKDSLIFIYDAIFGFKLGHYFENQSPLLSQIQTYGSIVTK